jgi:hypothetical protein
VLSRSVIDSERTQMFARYSLVGALAAALGALASASPEVLTSLGISRLSALRAMFVSMPLSAWVALPSTRRFPLLQRQSRINP